MPSGAFAEKVEYRIQETVGDQNSCRSVWLLTMAEVSARRKFVDMEESLHEAAARDVAAKRDQALAAKTMSYTRSDGQKQSLTLKQVDGYPMIVPESSWVPPLGYQSEGPFLVAAYQSLTGVDIYYWFAMGEEDWRQPSSANGYMPSVFSSYSIRAWSVDQRNRRRRLVSRR